MPCYTKHYGEKIHFFLWFVSAGVLLYHKQGADGAVLCKRIEVFTLALQAPRGCLVLLFNKQF